MILDKGFPPLCVYLSVGLILEIVNFKGDKITTSRGELSFLMVRYIMSEYWSSGLTEEQELGYIDVDWLVSIRASYPQWVTSKNILIYSPLLFLHDRDDIRVYYDVVKKDGMESFKIFFLYRFSFILYMYV